MKTFELTATTINIPVQVGSTSWAKCWLKAKKQGPLFGSQECFAQGQKALYRRLAKRHGWGKFGVGHPNPVFWDKNVYEKIDARVIMLHAESKGKLARKKPGFNAERYMTEVVLRHKTTGLIVVVENFHWVPEQFVTAIFRASARHKSKKIARDRIKLHKSMGRIVVPMGDSNIYKRIKLAGTVWMRALGIDKLGVAVPPKMKVVKATNDPFQAPTDHKRGYKGQATINY